MTELTAYSYFDNTYKLQDSSNGWYSFDCPFCGKKKKHAVSFEYMWCKCWSCNYSNRLIKFIMDTERLTFTEVKDIIKMENSYILKAKNINDTVSSVKLPLGYTPILEGEGPHAELAREYLKKRNFDLKFLDKLGIGYVEDKNSEYYGYIIIPFKIKNRLTYFISRAYISNKIKYKNPKINEFNLGKGEILWNEDALCTKDKIYIMEGVFSALTVGDSGVALLGKTISSVQVRKILKSHVEEIVLCLDPNCKRESFSIAQYFIEFKKVKVLTLLTGDPNDLGKSEILNLENNTKYSDYNSLTELLYV